MHTAREVPASDDLSTRARVIQAVLRRGPSTAADLATELGLTPAAVRRHLDHWLGEGLLAQREQRVSAPRGRGRPAKVYAISDAGRDRFTHAYDELAVEALEFLAAAGGESAVRAFAQSRVADLEVRLGAVLATVDPADRPAALAEALTAEGFAASVSPTDTGNQMCQHHCPVAHVAERFPHLCEAETEMFSRLLDTHVQRLATIAHGDGVCTTHLPNPHRERVSS